MGRAVLLVLLLISTSCTRDGLDRSKFPASSHEGIIVFELPNGTSTAVEYRPELAINIALAQNTPKTRVHVGPMLPDGTATIYIHTNSDSWIGKIGSTRLILPERPEHVFRSANGKIYAKEYYEDLGKWGWTDMDSEQSLAKCTDCPAP